MGRKGDLERLIREDYERIHEYEHIERDSDRPEEKARARRKIEEYKALLRERLSEYAPLCRRSDQPCPHDIVELAAWLGVDLNTAGSMPTIQSRPEGGDPKRWAWLERLGFRRDQLRYIDGGIDPFQRVQKFIEDIKNDLVGASLILNLFGPQGFGKTAFLEQIWDEYERVLPASLVHVGDLRGESDETFALGRILIHIADQLGERIPRRVAPLPSDYKKWTDEKQLAELLHSQLSHKEVVELIHMIEELDGSFALSAKIIQSVLSNFTTDLEIGEVVKFSEFPEVYEVAKHFVKKYECEQEQ